MSAVNRYPEQESPRVESDSESRSTPDHAWQHIAEERSRRITELEKELAIIQSGYSWRLTAPLRRTRRKAQDALQVARRVLAAIAGRAQRWHLRARVVRTLRQAFGHLPPQAQGYVRRAVRGRDGAPAQPPAPMNDLTLAPSPSVGASVSQVPLRHRQALVSVVIPCFNYGQFIREAIDSVLRQTLSDVEVIVVDDGSSDAFTQHMLDTLEVPRTTVLRRPNGGLAAARNQGIAAAKGRYICCLDADDRIAPTYLEKATAILESDQGAGFVYSWVQLFGDDTDVWRTEPFDLAELRNRNFVSVASVFRKSDWERVGGFAVDMRNGYEDWEFWLRLGAAGVRGVLVPEPLLEHRLHGRTMIHDARDRHAELLNDLRERHPELYRDDETVRRVQREYTVVPVDDPFANLERARVHDGKRRVLAIVPWLPAGGGEAVLHAVVRGLLSRPDVRVTIVTCEPSRNEWHHRFAALTDDIFHLPACLPRPHWSAFVHYLVRSRRAECVLVSGTRFGYSMLPDLKAAYPHVRTAEILHNSAPIGHIASSREFSASIDHHIAVSRAIGATLCDLGISESKIEVIPNGVDTQLFDPSRFKSDEARRACKLPLNGPVITYIGRLNPEKRPLEFLDVADELLTTPARFLMVGDGPEAGAVQSRLNDARLGSRLRWFRNIPPEQIPTILAASDALAITSSIEGLPIVMLEALAMGVPVFTYDVGDVRSAITDGVNGYVVDSGDRAALTRAIAQFAMSPGQQQVLKSAARATLIERGFSLSVLQNAYNRILLDPVPRAEIAAV